MLLLEKVDKSKLINLSANGFFSHNQMMRPNELDQLYLEILLKHLALILWELHCIVNQMNLLFQISWGL